MIALAAVKLNIPVAHIESCVKSYNLNMLEEINCIFNYHISKFFFYPTPTTEENLKDEAKKIKILQSDDVMYDALLGNIKIV